MGRVTVVGSYIVALSMDTCRLPVEGETVLGPKLPGDSRWQGVQHGSLRPTPGRRIGVPGQSRAGIFGEQFLSLLKNREGLRRRGAVLREASDRRRIHRLQTLGSNAIVIDMGANGELTPSDITAHEDLIKRSDVILSPLDIPFEVAFAAARLGSLHGAKCILNPVACH